MAPKINPPIYDLESPLRGGRPVKYLVVHTAECAEVDGNDDAISAYLARMSNASIHVSIDNNSITPSVPEDRVAWAASNPLINNYALQAEWVGRADQGSAGWDDQFSRDQMEVAAWLYARWAVEHSVPIVHGSVQDLRDGKPGFYGHVDSTRAWSNPDGHYDPGQTFPWDRFLDRVRAYAGGSAAGLSNQPTTQPPSLEDDEMDVAIARNQNTGGVYLVLFVKGVPISRRHLPTPADVDFYRSPPGNIFPPVNDLGDQAALLDRVPEAS